MTDMSETKLIQSWESNAQGWTKAVRDQLIASRVAVTDRAVLEAVGEGAGRSVLDLGCGEGWLSRELARLGWNVTAVDAVEELIQAAQLTAPGDYRVGNFEQLDQVLFGCSFHTVVANFSLLGEESTRAAVRSCRKLLQPGGRVIIQTLHPCQVAPPYQDGWRTEDWRTLGDLQLTETPWYFRTLASWFSLLDEEGYQAIRVGEPRASGNEPVSSLLLVCSPR